MRRDMVDRFNLLICYKTTALTPVKSSAVPTQQDAQLICFSKAQN